MKDELQVQGLIINYKKISEDDYISLTDIAKLKTDDSSLVIGHWMRIRSTIDYLAIWETLYNQNFKPTEIGGFRNDCSLNTFTLSPQKWIGATNAVGIKSTSGRYGGTYAHKDIAFKFASWISVEFELYLIKEFQRLKETEQKQLAWSAKRELAKINYHIHTDAIKEYIVPTLSSAQLLYVYANEADLLNVAMFGKTAAEWRAENPDLKGNLRDYATIEQLLILANMESYNSIFIEQGELQNERLRLLILWLQTKLKFYSIMILNY